MEPLSGLDAFFLYLETDEMPMKAPVSVDEVGVAGGPLTLTGSTLSGEARELRDVTVYAYPAGDEAPILVGGTTVAAALKHIAETQGGQFGRSSFSVSLESLPPGTYDLLVVARSAVSPSLDSSTWVRGVTIK